MPVGVLDGATKLLHDYQDVFVGLKQFYGADASHISELKLQEFSHDGEKLQGLVATKPILKDEPVIVEPEQMMLRMPAGYERTKGFEHLKDPYEKLAFWLAQQKVDLVDHPPADAKLNPVEEMTASYIGSLPKLKDYRNQGIPLVGSYGDLHKMEGLPHLGALVKSIDEQRESLLDSWSDYSHKRGHDLSKFGYTDALWGLTVARNRGFQFSSQGDQVYLTPMTDMPNFAAGTDSNLKVGMMTSDGAREAGNMDAGIISAEAAKDIKAGDEILLDYSNGHPTPGLDLLAKHGFFNAKAASDVEGWTMEDCEKVRATLTPDVMNNTKSKMLEAVGKLVDQSCPAPAEEAQGATDSNVDKVAAASVSDSDKAAAADNTADDKTSIVNKKEDASVQMIHPLMALASPFGQRSVVGRSRGLRYASFL
jgi:hypothetical protein